MRLNILESYGKSFPVLDPAKITNVAAFLRRPVWILFYCIPILMIGSLSHAQSLSILVSNAQFTTYVEAQGYSITPPPPKVSRLEMSSSPLNDEIDMPYPEYFSNAVNHAIASGNYFDVSTAVGWGFANAAVTNQIWFSPLTDQIQTLELGIQIYSLFGNSGSVSLFDLTANSELWNYYWNNYSNNIAFNNNGNADSNLVTSFLATHQYQLTMALSSNAGDDTDSAQIQLTGLQVVTPFQLTGTTISNGTPWFVLNGLGSNTYTIQISSDLVNWASLSTNTEPSTGAMLLNDASPNKPQNRFYRAVPWPVGSAFLSAPAGRISPPFTIANQSIYQSIQTVIPTNGGLATYSFNISNPGNYTVQALVNAPNDGANSIFLNIDADPQAPRMISDIFPFTSGFEMRTLSWRGNGADTNNQYIPKVFNLTYGAHQLVIRGREAYTQLKNISIVPYP
jgi:hypothetical protein